MDKWEKEREKFESWQDKKHGYSLVRSGFTGEYDSEFTRGAWEAWKYLIGPYREGAKDHA